MDANDRKRAGLDLDPMEGVEERRPAITLDANLVAQVEACSSVLANDDTVYLHAGALVRVVDGDEPKIEPLTNHRVRLILAGGADFKVQTKDGLKPAKPPLDLATTVLEAGSREDVRPLDLLVTRPVLLPDGRVVSSKGYDEASRVLYLPQRDAPPVASKPSQAEAKQAAARLLDLVGDFPFAGDDARAAWLSLVLTLAARMAYTGPSPIFAVTATKGVGKDKSVHLASIVATGAPTFERQWPQRPEEQEKTLAAAVRSGVRLCHFANVPSGGAIGGNKLDQMTTTGDFAGRILGLTEEFTVPNVRTVLVFTGNNVRYLSDTGRRVLPIELTTTLLRPWERDGFKHENVLDYARQNADAYLVDALTILRAYVVAGRPKLTTKAWGSFEGWNALPRQAVVFAGLPDPVAARAAVDDADEDAAQHERIVGLAMEYQRQSEPWKVADLVDAILRDTREERRRDAIDVLDDLDCVPGGRISNKKLGQRLGEFANRRTAGGYFIVRGNKDRTGAVRWRVTN